MTDLKTPEQLSVGVTAIGTASGRTLGLGSIMGSTWSDKIVFDAQPDRVLSKYFIEFNDLVGNNDVTIIIPKIGDINLMGGRTDYAEGTQRVMTKFDTASNITVSLTSANVKLGGCAISFETASATRVSIVEMAHKQLVRQYLNTLETDANALLEAATVHATTGAGTVFGGTTTADNQPLATGISALLAGDVIDVDKIVDMKIRLQTLNFGKRPGDAVLFLHPVQFKQLLKSSQFTNAAEFGAPTVVRQGVIEEYVGVKLEYSTLVTSASSPVANHNAYMIDPTAAAGIVWKEKAKIKVVTWDDERVHKVLMDAWYKMTVINPKAIVLAAFSDA
jgi:hypothetical protein